MSKHTPKPCPNGCEGSVRFTQLFSTCPHCFFTADEVKHWGEMPRAALRVAMKYAKKRKAFAERPSFKPYVQPTYPH